MKLSLTAATTLAAVLLLSSPAAAYTVVLEDGSKIMAEKEYRVRDGQAIIELPNGTFTSIDVDQIDVEATREANEAGYGKAVVIEGSETRTPDTRPQTQTEKRKSLADLVASREGGARLERHRREEASATETPTTTTQAGFTDLQSHPRRPFRHGEIATEMQRFFRGQGVDGVELYQGTEPTRPFAEITTNSEGSVFRSLEIAAEALLAVQENHPDRVTALELLLATPERKRAGQFVLTRELARDLVGEEVEVARFFVDHVQF